MSEAGTEAVQALRRARAAEKEQTVFYRLLAAEAEAAGRSDDAERLNELLADEQHHLSRLSARLLELGHETDDLRDVAAPDVELASWERVAREREQDEVRRYEAFAGHELDEQTARLIGEILDAERHHARVLGGKWMQA